jgi:hypothetical protein
MAWATRSRAAGNGTTSSSCIAMSAPSDCWIRIDSSGVSATGLPSMWDWKNAPSSVILARCARLNTWKPPLSVSVGPRQPMNAASPPASSTIRSPGLRCR